VLPPEAFSYLFARAPRDMRSLAALLVAIDRYSLEHKRANHPAAAARGSADLGTPLSDPARKQVAGATP
jgi:hypothetical protein